MTMDLFLDVAAIRLNGGFWTWEGKEITLGITHHMFISMIWMNFLGYMFETPAVLYISQMTQHPKGFWKQLLSILSIAIAGIAFVAISSGISLLCNAFTDEWFSCIAFLCIWTYTLFLILKSVKTGYHISSPKKWDIPSLIYWSAMYVFCMASLVHLDIAKAKPWYMFLCILFYMMTILLTIQKEQRQ